MSDETAPDIAGGDVLPSVSRGGNGYSRPVPRLRLTYPDLGAQAVENGSQFIEVKVRRWLDRQHCILWGEFNLSDAADKERAVEWLLHQVLGVLDAERE